MLGITLPLLVVSRRAARLAHRFAATLDKIAKTPANTIYVTVLGDVVDHEQKARGIARRIAKEIRDGDRPSTTSP